MMKPIFLSAGFTILRSSGGMSVQHLHRVSAFCTIVVLRFLLAVHAISSEVVGAYDRTVILILSVIHSHSHVFQTRLS